MQSKKGSLAEATTNLIVGLVLDLIANAIIFPLYGFHLSLMANLSIAPIYMVISLVRTYALRRLFNGFLKNPTLHPPLALKEGDLVVCIKTHILPNSLSYSKGTIIAVPENGGFFTYPNSKANWRKLTTTEAQLVADEVSESRISRGGGWAARVGVGFPTR